MQSSKFAFANNILAVVVSICFWVCGWRRRIRLPVQYFISVIIRGQKSSSFNINEVDDLDQISGCSYMRALDENVLTSEILSAWILQKLILYPVGSIALRSIPRRSGKLTLHRRIVCLIGSGGTWVHSCACFIVRYAVIELISYMRWIARAHVIAAQPPPVSVRSRSGLLTNHLVQKERNLNGSWQE